MIEEGRGKKLGRNSNGKGVNVNLSAPITVNAQGGDSQIAQKTGDSLLSQLERVVNQAGAIARI